MKDLMEKFIQEAFYDELQKIAEIPNFSYINRPSPAPAVKSMGGVYNAMRAQSLPAPQSPAIFRQSASQAPTGITGETQFAPGGRFASLGSKPSGGYQPNVPLTARGPRQATQTTNDRIRTTLGPTQGFKGSSIPSQKVTPESRMAEIQRTKDIRGVSSAEFGGGSRVARGSLGTMPRNQSLVQAPAGPTWTPELRQAYKTREAFSKNKGSAEYINAQNLINKAYGQGPQRTVPQAVAARTSAPNPSRQAIQQTNAGYNASNQSRITMGQLGESVAAAPRTGSQSVQQANTEFSIPKMQQRRGQILSDMQARGQIKPGQQIQAYNSAERMARAEQFIPRK